MFERFHPDARRVFVRAQHEAERAGHREIGCEHLLLALVAEPGPAASALAAANVGLAELRGHTPTSADDQPDPLDADALAALGIDLDAVRRAVDATFGKGALDRAAAPRRTRLGPIGGTRLTPEAKKAVGLALRAALRLSHRHISSGHLLVGLLDQPGNVALRMLARSGVDAAALRADVVARLEAAA
jgi:ATP-dependent Clp protease ATP-binding subunit ClpA